MMTILSPGVFAAHRRPIEWFPFLVAHPEVFIIGICLHYLGLNATLRVILSLAPTKEGQHDVPVDYRGYQTALSSTCKFHPCSM